MKKHLWNDTVNKKKDKEYGLYIHSSYIHSSKYILMYSFTNHETPWQMGSHKDRNERKSKLLLLKRIHWPVTSLRIPKLSAPQIRVHINISQWAFTHISTSADQRLPESSLQSKEQLAEEKRQEISFQDRRPVRISTFGCRVQIWHFWFHLPDPYTHLQKRGVYGFSYVNLQTRRRKCADVEMLCFR